LTRIGSMKVRTTGRMAAEMRKRAASKGTIKCVGCGEKGTFPITSPAAPALSMCEEAAKVGWGYQIGFFAMMTGDHQPVCPKCIKRTRGVQEGMTS